jgi:hypothetical protein
VAYSDYAQETRRKRDRTILSLLALVGERCEKLMDERIKGLKVKEVACDEIWGYVGMKARTKTRKKITDGKTGDAWCFIGMERYTKLILAWHLGHRNMDDTIPQTRCRARRHSATTKAEARINASVSSLVCFFRRSRSYPCFPFHS